MLFDWNIRDNGSPDIEKPLYPRDGEANGFVANGIPTALARTNHHGRTSEAKRQGFCEPIVAGGPLNANTTLQTLAVGQLTRLSVRETPHPRPFPYLTFDVRSRATWRAIPQQAVGFATFSL